MASILPIAGAVAGNFIAPGIGGAIGGGLGSLASNYIQKGNLTGADAVSAVGSGVAGYAAGGGFDSVGSETPGAVAGPGTAAAATPTVQALSSAAYQPQLPQTPGMTAQAPNIPPTPGFSPPPPPTAPPPPPAAPMPVNGPQPGSIQAPNIPATPTGWMARDSGVLGLTHGQALGYGGLGALGLLGSGLLGGNGAAPTQVAHPTPTLSRTPTNRQFTAAQVGYRPGHDPEHSYFQMARGGRVRGFYEGGGTEAGKDGGDGGYGDGGAKGGGATSEGGGYQGGDGGGKGGGGSFGGSIDSGSGMSSVGSGPGPVGGGDPWGAGISNMGYSGGLDAGSGPGMGGSGLGGNWGGGGGYSGIGQAQYGAGAQGPVGPLGPQMATLGINRRIIQPAAGYRPGFSPEHTFIQTMADGGTVDPTRVTAPDGRRFIQRKVTNSGSSDLLGGLFGGGGGDDTEWVEDTSPVLATKPIDRGYTPAPEGYRPGHDPEWTYFHDPVPAPKMADGGIANAQVQGQGQIPGYIRGDGDGVSDSIRGTIDGREPVDLSTGEFVIPARTVSGLGNGSSEAGARKLHRMMQRVDQARARMAKGGTVNDARVLPA